MIIRSLDEPAMAPVITGREAVKDKTVPRERPMPAYIAVTPRQLSKT
jgi:hypothetical protein